MLMLSCLRLDDTIFTSQYITVVLYYSVFSFNIYVRPISTCLVHVNTEDILLKLFSEISVRGSNFFLILSLILIELFCYLLLVFLFNLF